MDASWVPVGNVKQDIDDLRENHSNQMKYPVPLYIVAAPLRSTSTLVPPSLVTESPVGTFDEDLLPALPGIWYAMHLPKSRIDILDLPLEGILDQTNGTRSHAILLIPDSLLADADIMQRLLAPYEPALIITSRESLVLAQKVHSEFGFILPPVSFEDLSQTLLTDHWTRLAKDWESGWAPGMTVDESIPLWKWPAPTDGSLLTLQRISRMMGSPMMVIPDYEGPFHSAAKVRGSRVNLEAFVSLEREGHDEVSAAHAYPDAIRITSETSRTHLAVSLGGTPPRYKKLAVSQAGSVEVEFLDRYPEVHTILVTHAALANESMGLVLEDVITPEMFHCLAELESHWISAAKPKAVQRILARLDKASAHIWSDPMIAAIRCASSIDAFTDFPLGLLTVPGDTSPLSTRLPISYRSVNPLTRALQLELSPQVQHDFSRGFRVLIAECISDDDIVGRLSRVAWRLVQTEMKASGARIEVVIVEASTSEELRRAIAEAGAEVLVLSAHGFFSSEANIAGIMIGDEPSLGDDLGPMPPLVVLSACHTSPRGTGAVNVADQLLRMGAEAVLSTLVPVDVRHNAQLVSRFFRYMALMVEGDTNYSMRTVLDVWHEVQALNVIIDMVSGNERFAEWAMGKSHLNSPIGRFMSGPHGLRRGHLYESAEKRIIEIAAETGDQDKVRSWLRSPGYLPESLMYMMLGRPHNLLVQMPE